MNDISLAIYINISVLFSFRSLPFISLSVHSIGYITSPCFETVPSINTQYLLSQHLVPDDH